MKKYKNKFTLPESCLLEIYGTSSFGDLMAKTVDRKDNPEDRKIYVLENKRIKPALQVGDKFIGKITNHNNNFWAKPVARTSTTEGAAAAEKIYGVIEQRDNKIYLKPAQKNIHMDYLLDNIGKAKVGDFVAVMLVGDRKFKEAKIIKSFGKFDLNKATSALILDKYDIPQEFPEQVLREAAHSPKFDKASRVDLTQIPLVTIDGDDSKDFDDAVYAKKTEHGFELVVAIADVAFYVRHLSELDREAYKRGNSVYLPNMVVPMLPEALSNDLCSLKPKVERAAIACMMSIDNNGNLLKYDFKRAVIKSAARLTYAEVQNAIDGKFNDQTIGLFKNVIQPLYEAYFALDKAKKRRGALELDIPEIKVKIDKNGNIQSITKAEHYTSHSIVEEFMITANVAAAKALAKLKMPIMYRVHEKPLEEKLKDIKPLLHNLELKLPEQPALKPEHFNKILARCAELGYSAGICTLILRLQAQAKYSPEHLGHFGLGLSDYAHFTSPIRRYADLLIHRALIKGYNMLDGGGLEDGVDDKIFTEIGEHISITERKAVSAERDMVARYLSAYLEPSVGTEFEVKISGLSTAGIFVAIENLGAEGLIPMRSLPDDDYELGSFGSALVGRVTERRFGFGDVIKAKLIEASPITGGLIFKFVDEKEGTDYPEKGGNRGFHPRKKEGFKSSPKTKDKAKSKQRKEEIKNKNKKSKAKKSPKK